MAKALDPTNGFIVHGWMVTHLNLTGYELAIYAIVHQFSQSKAGVYTGGVPYVMKWLGCSDVTARKYLHSLEAKGLIVSIAGDRDGVPFRNYEVADNHIPKNFGDIPKNIGIDTQDFYADTPKNFGGENNIDNKENNNTPLYPPKGGRFVAPTVQDVKSYCSEKGYAHVDAEAFVAFYASKGWKVGSQPMKDWRAAIVTWEKRRQAEHPTPKTPAPRRQTINPLDIDLTALYADDKD